MRRAALCLAIALAAAPALGAPDLSADGLLRDHLWRELLSMPAQKRPKVGLVLSAGSLRAVTHVGVLSVLENAGFPVDVVAGTSMGAVLGSLYAAGRPVSRIWEIVSAFKPGTGNNLNALSLIRLIVSDKLLSSENTEKLVRGELGGKRFEDLKKPFACVAMDLYSGEALIFREGDVGLAVRASMNLPGIFSPVEYRHRYLVDGGVVDYIPVDAARLLGADWVLASIAETDYTQSKPENVLQSLEQVIDIRGALLSREQRRQANFLIEPPVGDIGMVESERVQEAVGKGVVAANKRLKAAMESLLLFSLPRMTPAYLPQNGERSR